MAESDRSGDNYVVVSADTHASPDDIEHFLSYVDPADRAMVADLGELSSAAISMFGGVEAGEITDPDPVRETAARRLAGMGVDIDATSEWLARYSSDWVIPGDGDGRRLAVLEEQGVHAEVTYPGPVLVGGLANAMYRGANKAEGLDAVWPALHALQPMVGRLLFGRTWSPGRMHPDRSSRHGPRGGRDRMGPRIRLVRWRHVAGHVHGVRTSRLLRPVLRPVLERVRGPVDGGQPPHRRLGRTHRRALPVRHRTRRPARALRGVRLHSTPALVPDPRGRVRSASRPEGGRRRERGAVAAGPDPRHGAVLRHPRQRAGTGGAEACGRPSTSTVTCHSAAR